MLTALTAIIKRELIDHIISLKFSLIMALTVILMTLNAFSFVHGTYDFKMSRYIENVQEINEQRARDASWGLWKLAISGPGDIYKVPSKLAFCAVGSDRALPEYLGAYSDVQGFIAMTSIRYPWVLSFPIALNANTGSIAPSMDIDWVFIIGVMVSLASLLFTFDAIVGEKERGTLKLVMSNEVPKHIVLQGKYFSAMIALALIITIACVFNLLVVLLFSDMEFSHADVVRLGAMALLSLIYIAGFTALGLFVSSRCESSRTGLVVVLLLWAGLVLLWPNTGGAIAGRLLDVQTEDEIWHNYEESIPYKRLTEFVIQATPRQMREPNFLQEYSEVMRARRDFDQSKENQLLAQRLGQVEAAENIVRLSPMGLYKQAMEALAGTGMARHRNFIHQARDFCQLFEQHVTNLDHDDTKSLHIPLIEQGLSRKQVDPRDIPTFKEDFSVMATLQVVAIDVALLLLFCVGSYMVAYWSWIRMEIV